MNKLKKISLVILGGIDVVVTVITPIMLAIIWISLFGILNWTSYFLLIICGLSSLFRAIKIGWIKR